MIGYLEGTTAALDNARKTAQGIYNQHSGTVD